ncbi:hypothetical protein ACVMII_005409 [Bradyrhizobium diazoefficiens]
MTNAPQPRDLETDEERDRLGHWLVDEAPKDIGTDQKGKERFRTMIDTIISRFPGARMGDVLYCLSNWWLLRNKPSLPPEFLKTVLQDAFDAAVLDGRHKSCSIEERWQLKRGAERRRTEKRQKNAELVRQVAHSVGCGIRYARMLISDGTSNLEIAAKLAGVLGTKPDEHLRMKKRTGRQPDLVGWFMKISIPNSSFRDFLEEDPSDLPASSWDLLELLREQKGALKAEQERIGSLENLVEHCRSLPLHYSVTERADQIWRAYKLWKIEITSAQATRLANDGHWADLIEGDNRIKIRT